MTLVALKDPPSPEVRLAGHVEAHHEGLLAEALRQMAHELYAYERARLAGMEETVERTVEFMTNRLGRRPTAEEVAVAAGVLVEDVLEARLGAR
jgi:hypothetical protein